MEARISRPNGSGVVNKDELNTTTYPAYCEMYLIQHIYEQVPSTSTISYGNVSRLIGTISNSLYDNLNTETGKILLLNKIYNLFMQLDVELSREFLYRLVSHLNEFYPAKAYADEYGM